MKDIRYNIYKDGKSITVPPIDELCTALKEKFLHQEETIEHLKEEIENLKNENWKDEELQKIKTKYEGMRKDYWRGFPISEKDYEKAQNWIDDHEATKHPRKSSYLRGGAIGGSYQWIFTPTSIGTFGEVKCSCGESFTFADDF